MNPEWNAGSCSGQAIAGWMDRLVDRVDGRTDGSMKRNKEILVKLCNEKKGGRKKGGKGKEWQAERTIDGHGERKNTKERKKKRIRYKQKTYVGRNEEWKKVCKRGQMKTKYMLEERNKIGEGRKEG